MHSVKLDDVEWSGSGTRHRVGTEKFKYLLRGQHGARDNYELSLFWTPPTYSTPRHHHNFDQLRLTLQGEFEWAPGRATGPGGVVYMPEGTYYGPQGGIDSVVLLLQFGGANGAGFMGYDELRRGYRELAEVGTFEDGIYRGPGADGAHQEVDSYQAIYEHVMGRPVVYPPARYEDPVEMDPTAYAWVPEPGEPGVERKVLGRFSERGTELGFLRWSEGAVHEVGQLRARLVMFLQSGHLLWGEETIEGPGAFALEIEDSGSSLAATDMAAEAFYVSFPVFDG